jgi:hypothetical protein
MSRIQDKETHPATHAPTMPSCFDVSRQINRFLFPDGASRLASHGIEFYSDEQNLTTDNE